MAHRSASPPKATACVKLAHRVLRTGRLEELKRWYQEVLQARIVFADALLALLAYDEEHPRVALLHDPGTQALPNRAAGLEHVAFTDAALGNLFGSYERLPAESIAAYGCLHHGPTTSMDDTDPDGTHVELQIDNHPDTASLDARFQSGAFARNPIGVSFDPEVLAVCSRRGDAVAELAQQGPAPRAPAAGMR